MRFETGWIPQHNGFWRRPQGSGKGKGNNQGKGKQKAKTSPSESPSKKKQSASQKKRLAALTEVINEKEPLIVVDEEQSKSSAEDYGVTTGGSVKDEGFMGKLKGFYEKR